MYIIFWWRVFMLSNNSYDLLANMNVNSAQIRAKYQNGVINHVSTVWWTESFSAGRKSEPVCINECFFTTVKFDLLWWISTLMSFPCCTIVLVFFYLVVFLLFQCSSCHASCEDDALPAGWVCTPLQVCPASTRSLPHSSSSSRLWALARSLPLPFFHSLSLCQYRKSSV